MSTMEHFVEKLCWYMLVDLMTMSSENLLLAFSTYIVLGLLALLLCYISFKDYENSPTESLHKRSGFKTCGLFLFKNKV